MSGNPTAVREVLQAILKTSRKKASPEVVAGIRARLLKEPGFDMSDDDLDALAEAESWRLEEAQSLLASGRKKFPKANFDDIAAILRKLETLREADPRSVDVLLGEAMERYWQRIEHLKAYPALSQRLKELTAAVGEDIAAIERDVRKALADSAAALKLDDLKPDPADVDALKDLAEAAMVLAKAWRDELAALRKQLEEDASEVSADMIDTAADNAAQDRKAPQAALEQGLRALTAATEALCQAQKARLDGNDEMKLSNRFNVKKPKITEKLAKAFCEELSIKPEKWHSAFEYLQALEGAGDNKTAQARASRQKPSVALAAYLELAEPTAWATHGAFVRERANDFDGRQDTAAAVLRALAAINSPDREANLRLLRLALNGTPLHVLAKYHAARGDMEGLSVPSAYSRRLDEVMDKPGFDAKVWSRLKGWAKTNSLFLSSVVAYLKTEDEALARQVAEDFYGLVASSRPGSTEEGRIAAGLTAGVIEQNKQRTVHSTATGSGHAYKYSYAGGLVRAAWELHVHEGHANLYPAWKGVSNPREYVGGRDKYNINSALRSLLK